MDHRLVDHQNGPLSTMLKDALCGMDDLRQMADISPFGPKLDVSNTITRVETDLRQVLRAITETVRVR